MESEEKILYKKEEKNTQKGTEICEERIDK